jgi:hypothetical protein
MISLKAQYPDNQISLLEAQQTQLALVSLRSMLTVMCALEQETNHKIYVPEVQCQLPISHSCHNVKHLKTLTEMCWALGFTDTIQYILLYQKYEIPPH